MIEFHLTSQPLDRDVKGWTEVAKVLDVCETRSKILVSNGCILLTPRLGEGVVKLEPIVGTHVTSREYNLRCTKKSGLIQNATDKCVNHRCLLKTVRNLDV